MIHLLDTAAPQRSVRVWTSPDWPTGHAPDFGIAVEWAGQLGHPTSYALVGGYPSTEDTIDVPDDGPPFRKSLAGIYDNVHFGLPPHSDYRQAVLDALRESIAAPSGFTVTTAAHGRTGSSYVAFYVAAAFAALMSIQPAVIDDDWLIGRWQAAWAKWRDR